MLPWWLMADTSPRESIDGADPDPEIDDLIRDAPAARPPDSATEAARNISPEEAPAQFTALWKKQPRNSSLIAQLRHPILLAMASARSPIFSACRNPTVRVFSPGVFRWNAHGHPRTPNVQRLAKCSSVRRLQRSTCPAHLSPLPPPGPPKRIGGKTIEKFWLELPPREKSAVLRGQDFGACRLLPSNKISASSRFWPMRHVARPATSC